MRHSHSRKFRQRLIIVFTNSEILFTLYKSYQQIILDTHIILHTITIYFD